MILLSKLIDLTNCKFGLLKVIKYVRLEGIGNRWECECQCEKKSIIYATGSDLRSGKVKSCGCLRRDNAINLGKNYSSKPNTFIEYEDCVIGLDGDNSFIIDIEDYTRVKQYNWHLKKGYWYSKNLNLSLQNFILGKQAGFIVDHIDRNKNNNRKRNLRHITQANNTKNRTKPNNNTSGTMGVSFCKNSNKWRARICVDKKTIYLGYYEEIEDAIKARKEAEIKYFGEYAPRVREDELNER